jgi:hypothetical protein
MPDHSGLEPEQEPLTKTSTPANLDLCPMWSCREGGYQVGFPAVSLGPNERCTYALAKSDGTSSAQTRNPDKLAGPNVLVRGADVSTCYVRA